jgi:hypothetical protein
VISNQGILTVWWRKSRTHNSELAFASYTFIDGNVEKQVDDPEKRKDGKMYKKSLDLSYAHLALLGLMVMA